MNFTAITMIIIILTLILYTIIDKYSYLSINENDEKIVLKSKKVDDELLIKYSSIKNKLTTVDDYVKFLNYLNTINSSIYISIIDSVVTNYTHIVNLIIGDIEKTKIRYSFKKLKNIYAIIKIKEEINDLNTSYAKIILFYDGLIFNEKRFQFIENDFTGNTIVYKLNFKNKLINHYLQ
uniref:Uncharacterized protein n=1 Tax=viral metagenome TaxID=1070528 RepID=A0A6C0DMI9_9ZZZZ